MSSKSNGPRMTSIFFFTPDLGLNGEAKQVSLLAPALAREGFAVHVAVRNDDGIFTDRMQNSGVVLHSLRCGRYCKPTAGLTLSKMIAGARPDLIVTSRIAALRQIVIMGLLRRLPPVVAVDVFADPASLLLRRLLLRRATAIIARGEWERRRALKFGVSEDRIRVIPPCVSEAAIPDRESSLRDLNLPPHARLVVCAGSIEPGHGFREAAWVLNILGYVYPELWLLMIGDGSDRRRVAEFARAGGTAKPRIRFAGVRPDAASLMGLAEVVWILGERGGRNVALEALAAGRPVVARRRPELAEILGDGETGFLVDRADRHELARATRRILDHPEQKRMFEAAATARAERFDVSRVVPQWLKLMESRQAVLHLRGDGLF
jgi:glycosyltransferase involved in cell wall biosynthesis